MKSISLSLLLVFAAFNVVLSTYYLWQDDDFQVAMPIEEEEDHSKETSVPFKAIFESDKMLLDLLAHEENEAVSKLNENKNYEDVYLNAPYSPPDVM